MEMEVMEEGIVGSTIELEIDGEVELSADEGEIEQIEQMEQMEQMEQIEQIEQIEQLDRAEQIQQIDPRCRVCLEAADRDSLFAEDRHLKLASCVALPVKKDDTLPSGICEKCTQHLEICYSFKSLAEKSFAMLLCKQISKNNSQSPSRIPTVRNRNAIEVSNIQNLKDLNSLLFEPPQTDASNNYLADKIQESILSSENAHVTLCNTVIKKANSGIYEYSLEFEEEVASTEDSSSMPEDLLDDDLPRTSIRVHKFENYVEKRMLQDRKEIKIINEKEEEEEEDPNPVEYFADNVELEEFFVTNMQNEDNLEIVKEEYLQDETYEDDSPCNYYTTTTEDIITMADVSPEKKPKPAARNVKIAEEIVDNPYQKKIILIKDNVVKGTKHLLKKDNFVKEKHVCPVCGILTYSIGAHLSMHHENKPYVCQVCGRTYNHKSHYDLHMKRHTGIKDNICEICGAAYLFSKSLMRHKLVHSGEKPFTCDKCPMRFYVKCDLTRHLKVHAGIKPFVCSICSVAFNAKHQLLNHIRMHTGEKPFTCEICDLAFTYKVNLNNHCLRVHHLNIKFKSIHKLTQKILNELYQEQNPQVEIQYTPPPKPRRKGLLKPNYEQYMRNKKR